MASVFGVCFNNLIFFLLHILYSGKQRIHIGLDSSKDVKNLVEMSQGTDNIKGKILKSFQIHPPPLKFRCPLSTNYRLLSELLLGLW